MDRAATVSLELFTPRSAAGVDELLAAGGRLTQYAALGPSFVSVSGTTGASLSILEAVKKGHCIRPQLHIARAEMKNEEAVVSLVDGARRLGIVDVLVLGGAPGSMQPSAPGSFASVTDLVGFLKRRYGDRLRIAVCGYPRGTRGEAGDYTSDLVQLGRQAAAGAEMVVSLPVFEAAEHARFVADARNAGVACPVLPGILPLCGASEFRRLCRALYVTPPAETERQLDAESAKGDEAVKQLAQGTLVRLVEELRAQGACAPHVYTLNSPSVLSYLAAAGFRPLKHRLA